MYVYQNDFEASKPSLGNQDITHAFTITNTYLCEELSYLREVGVVIQAKRFASVATKHLVDFERASIYYCPTRKSWTVHVHNGVPIVDGPPMANYMETGAPAALTVAQYSVYKKRFGIAAQAAKSLEKRFGMSGNRVSTNPMSGMSGAQMRQHHRVSNNLYDPFR